MGVEGAVQGISGCFMDLEAILRIGLVATAIVYLCELWIRVCTMVFHLGTG